METGGRIEGGRLRVRGRKVEREGGREGEREGGRVRRRVRERLKLNHRIKLSKMKSGNIT